MNKLPGFIFEKMTRIVKVENLSVDLYEAVSVLKQGRPVAMPTETVYGLAANALDGQAAESIFRVKNRPSDNPLIVHISSMEMLKRVVAVDPSTGEPLIPEKLRSVLDRFWPGPLTVLLPKGPNVPDQVTAGLRTVAVRFPRHPVAKALIEQADMPLAAPSANLSGRPSPTTAQHVFDDLNGRVDLILDGGKCSFGLESTVLNALVSPPVILRPGSITLTMLREYLPDCQIYKPDAKDIERPATPGLKYRHYSPTCPVILFHNHGKVDEYLNTELAGKKIVRLLNGPVEPLAYPHIVLSERNDPEEIARNLFDGLRQADTMGRDYIICEAVSEDDEGLAIMNRLSKAASHSVY